MTTPQPADAVAPRLTLPRVALLVLAPFGCGYFMSYLFRAVNAVIAPDLVGEFGLTATALGLLTSAYIFAFAAFQLPLGVLLDRFGPRRVQASMLTVAAVGAVIFALAPSEAWLIFGRGLIGLGSAVGLMASFKAVVLWTPPERVPLMNSAVMAFGGMGIVVATQPADFMVQLIGWRGVFFGLAVIALAVAGLILAAVPEKRQGLAGGDLAAQFRTLLRIYSDREFWRIAPFVATTAGAHIAIQTLWAGPWLADVAGLARDAVAFYLLATAIGFVIGVLGAGAIADRLRRYGVGELTVMTGALLLLMASQAVIVLRITDGMLLTWMVFGATGQLGILAFGYLSAWFGVSVAGRANTALNLIIFGTAFVTQYAIGWIIDLWPQQPGGGYPAEAYSVSFGIFLALEALALAWYLICPRGTRPTTAR